MSKELARRIAATPNNAVLDLAGEPMGDVALRVAGRGIRVRGLKASSVTLTSCSSLTLEDFDVDWKPTTSATNNSQAVRITDPVKVRLLGGRVTGGPSVNGIPADAVPKSPAHLADKTGNVIGLPCGKAINVANGRDVVLEDVDVSRFAKAVLFGGTDDVIVRRVKAHDLRSTPFSIAGCQRFLLEYSITRDSNPWAYGGDGDHGDCVHAWTLPGGKPMHDIIIRRNQFLQGAGKAMMGIYLDDNTNRLGYVDAQILENLIHNAHGQGMLLERVSGRVQENTLIGTGRGLRGADPRDNPRIVVTGGSRDIDFAGNDATIDLYKLTDAEKATMRMAA